MKKKIIFIIMFLFLVGCDKLKVDDIDSTSSPTKKFNSNNLGQPTSADKQFQSESAKEKDSEKITFIRGEFKNFLNENFSENSVKNFNFEKINYLINNKVISTIFDNEVKHIFKNNIFDYSIQLKKLEKKYSNTEFISEMLDRDKMLKKLDTESIGTVLVKNNDSSYSSEAHILYNYDNDSYYFYIKSSYMSIPEVVTLSEKFLSNVK